jgi:dipeptidyl aminopeptidase/acylaminoacyl peptidase
MERQIVFENEGQRLYGMLHLPDGEDTVPVVALFHGCKGTRIEPHRIFVKMARELMVHGIAALRFDFRGSGESEGDFVDMTVEGEISDAIASMNFLQIQPELDPDRIGVLGLSLGGLVAACVAGRDTRVKSLALWAALSLVEEVSFLADERHQRQLAEWGFIDWEGNLMGASFLEELAQMQPLEGVAHYQGPALIIHGTSDESLRVQNALAYQNAIPGRTELHIVESAGHTFDSHEWEEEVIEGTREWFLKTL